MICVSIAQTSHRLAYADLLNAAPLCDFVEIRLDRFDRSPDVKSLLDVCRKPAIVSCRRTADGGDWEGSEDARVALLRQAILAGADYVELETDVAAGVPRFGDCKRVVTYTNTKAVPRDLEDVYAKMRTQDPDVVKLTVPAKTAEQGFPVIKLLAKGSVPTVAVGWGRNALMLNVLAKRYGAPWAYAALEKGMEAYPGMPTIAELEDAYDFRAIDAKTPLLAVTGYSGEQLVAARVLNWGFREAGDRTRCLPLDMGDADLFAKVAKAIKLQGVIVDERLRRELVGLCDKKEDAVEAAGATDFIAIRKDKAGERKWRGFNTLYRGVLSCMRDAWLAKYPDEDDPLRGRTFVVVGTGGTGRSIAGGLLEKGASVVFADAEEADAKAAAKEIGGRFIAATQVYTAPADGLVVTRSRTDPQPGVGAIDLPTSTVRAGMMVVDLTRFPYGTKLLEECAYIGGTPVPASDIFLKMMQTVVRAYTDRKFTLEQLRAAAEGYGLDEPVAPRD